MTGAGRLANTYNKMVVRMRPYRLDSHGDATDRLPARNTEYIVEIEYHTLSSRSRAPTEMECCKVRQCWADVVGYKRDVLTVLSSES